MTGYPPEIYDDAQLLAEYRALLTARRKAAVGGEIEVVAGEGRRMEISPLNFDAVDRELREIGCEARSRGLSWAGDNSAIIVEMEG